MPAVSSFDVFDTVLTRRVGAPDALFTVVARQLLDESSIPTSAEVFAELRRSYENRLITASGRQVGLEMIYTELARSLAVEPSQADHWKHTEERIERELTVPVPGAARMISDARARGDRVIFVSDTPHTEAFLSELLVGHDLARAGDQVFTSADRGVSKALGGLFDVVKKDLGVEHRFEHVGDNPRADLAAPRVEGWSSSLVRGAKLTRYEELMERHALSTSSVSSWLAGSARLSRLEAVDRGVDAALAKVASGVVGPMLVGYALWVAAQARRQGIKRVYYAARDGQVMYKVAQHVLARVTPDIEVRYLYGSRQAWVASASAYSDEVLKRWLVVPRDSTARTTLRRVGLDIERLHQETQLPFLHSEHADNVLSPEDHRELGDRLFAEPVLSWVKTAAAETAAGTIAYLRQEGLFDGTPSALVDSGWGGMTAHALDVLLKQEGGSAVSHFFVGRTNPPDPNLPPLEGAYLPWLFDQYERPHSMAGLQAPTVVVEMLCAGTEGRTIGYQQAEDGWCPVFAAAQNDPALAWGVEQVHHVAERTAELVASHLPITEPVDCSPVAWDLLTLFWNHPTDDEVATWGRFPWEEEASVPFQDVAERVTTRTIARRLMSGDRHLRRNSSWRAGSARVSAQPWKTVLRSKAWADTNRARIRRAPRSIRMRLIRLRRR